MRHLSQYLIETRRAAQRPHRDRISDGSRSSEDGSYKRVSVACVGVDQGPVLHQLKSNLLQMKK